MADFTSRNHVKLLREAFHLAGLHPPAWLKHRPPNARLLSLTPDEFRQLLTHAFPPSQHPLAEERADLALPTAGGAALGPLAGKLPVVTQQNRHACMTFLDAAALPAKPN